MRITPLLLAAAAVTVTVAAARADHHMAAAIKTGESSKGEILTNASGMTLYTFANDKPDVSNCTGQCAVNWPPLAAAAGAKAEGGFTVIKRQDGSLQWAYKGEPLYTWVKDTKPGDVTGDGVKGVWHLARP